MALPVELTPETERLVICAIKALEPTAPYQAASDIPLPEGWPRRPNSWNDALKVIQEVASLPEGQAIPVLKGLVIRRKLLWERIFSTHPLLVKWEAAETFISEVIERLTTEPYTGFDQSRNCVESCGCSRDEAEHLLYFLRDWGILDPRSSDRRWILVENQT
jgi:hypothetical protein